jgi:hypothetical protein
LNFELYGQPSDIQFIRDLKPSAKELIPDCINLFFIKAPEETEFVRQGPDPKDTIILSLSSRTFFKLKLLVNMHNASRSVFLLTALKCFHEQAAINLAARHLALKNMKTPILPKLKRLLRTTKGMSIAEWCQELNTPTVTLYSHIKKLTQGRALFDLSMSDKMRAVLLEVMDSNTH